MKRFISTLLTLLIIIVPLSVSLGFDVDPNPGASAPLQPIGKNVLGYVQFIGYAIAMGMLIYVGIRYTMASANEKADLKKASINYVIGAIVIIGASSIFGILTNISGEVVGKK